MNLDTHPAAMPALDAQALYEELRTEMARRMGANDQLVGIASGGAWVAQALARDLARNTAAGVISSAMHRDDYAKRGLKVGLQTQLPFEVNGAHIWLIDDVLYTGRTIRAVINELFDFGRPSSVQLAVLVDRGARELPFCADWAAAQVRLPLGQQLALKVTDSGRFQFSLEDH